MQNRQRMHVNHTLCFRVLIAATLITIGTFSFSQDRPLGDVAREARKSGSPKSKKVFTDEDSEPKALKPEDDPLDVINRARLALIHDSHRCRDEASGNSGPGWARTETTEVSGRDRVHLIVVNQRPTSNQGEWIIIDDDAYVRSENSAWRKTVPLEMGIHPGSRAVEVLIPDPLKFGYKHGDFRLAGRDSIDGRPAFLYQFEIHSADMDRVIKLWISTNDGLLRRSDMSTLDKSMGTSWRQTDSCAYDVNVTIESPM